MTDVRGEVPASGHTHVLGAFVVGDLAPGTVTLAVSSHKHRPLTLPAEIGGAGTTRVQVELQPGAQVRGTVLGSAAPLGDALVTLVDAAGNVVATTAAARDRAYAFSVQHTKRPPPNCVSAVRRGSLSQRGGARVRTWVG